MAESSPPVLAQPLTRSTRAGTLYRRPPEVESQLEGLLRASADDQIARAKTTDKNASAYIADECLVYLVRAAGLADDAERYHTLAALLLKRVQRGIARKLRVLGVAEGDIEAVHHDVVLAMMTSILEEPRGEYYQVRFRAALRKQLAKSYDAYARGRRRARRERSLDAPLQDEAGDDEAHTTLGHVLPSDEDVAADVERRLLIPDALEAIVNPDHREAFVLHHYYGWQIESIDADEPTLSQLFDRTPRMVRLWLRTADRQLAEWRAAKRV